MSASNYLPSLYQQFIHKSRYARWLWDENRRENWDETVSRYFNFFEEHLKEMHNFDLDRETRNYLEESVLTLKTMPSMRCLMTAGEALKRENVAGYNCSYVAVDHPRSFDEILYILMNGTGVGFSVESKFTEQLPVVADDFHPSDTIIVVADSKLGWAKALKELIQLLYSGQVPKWDVSKVRAAGAPRRRDGRRSHRAHAGCQWRGPDRQAPGWDHGPGALRLPGRRRRGPQHRAGPGRPGTAALPPPDPRP